jgi:hypothetical protein
MKNSKLNSLELLDINLQLFASGEDDDSDNHSGVVDQNDDDSYDDTEGEEIEDDSSELKDSEDDNKEQKPEVTDPDKSKQSPEENAQFKKMRLKAEEEARKTLEVERAKLDAEKAELETFRKQREQESIEKKHLSEITLEVVQGVAAQYGVTEDYARAYLELEAKNNASKELAERKFKVSQAQIQKANLKDKPYFKELEADIDKTIASNPDIDVNTAYKYLIGENLEKLMKQTKSLTEKQTIANMQDKAKRRSVPASSSDVGIDADKILSADEVEMSIAFGNDPKAIAKTVREKLKTLKRR